MGVQVYISGNNGDQKIEHHQHRIITILRSLKIEFLLVDITAPSMEDQKQFMRSKAKKRDGQRVAMPPQIFNTDKYCGDYDDFDIANEDGVLSQFLGIIINGSKITPATRQTSTTFEIKETKEIKETTQDMELRPQVYPVSPFNSNEDPDPCLYVEAQAVYCERETKLETLSDWDFIENIIEVVHNKADISLADIDTEETDKVDLSVTDISKEKNEVYQSVKSKDSYTESFDASDKDELLKATMADENLNVEKAYTKYTDPPHQAQSISTFNKSHFSQHHQETPPTLRKRRGGPISNSIHFMLSAETLYNYK